MNRKEQKQAPAAPSLPPTLDGLNNVSDLISKFEVRNYPINRGLLPELSSPRPTPPGYAGIVPGAPEWYRQPPYGGAYHYSPTHSPPLGQTRRRSTNGGVPSQYDSSYLSDTASLSDGADSVSPGGRRMDDRARFRARQGGVYYQNGSLSSLNESDYYEDIGFDVGPRTPPSGRFYAPQQRRGEGAVLLEEVEEVPLHKEQVTSTLTRFGAILQMLSRIPFPRMSVTGMGLCSLVAIFFCPRAIGSNILFPGFRLLFGTLYPAYASYKAVRTKNVKEYVKWMMYWIVFAFFTFIETFTDILLSWFPFYYEIKVIVVLWLLSPATRGSSTLYRKFVHPMLTRREQEIDDYINQAKEKGYTAVLQLGSKGVNYATNVIMQTAIKVLGTKTDTNTPFGSMMRISQSDNSLLMSAAAAAAARASGAEPARTNGLPHTNMRDTTDHATSGEDEHDGQMVTAATTGTATGRVRRSQSVDSALNSRGGGGGGGRATMSSSRSMTRARAQQQQPPAIIYEMDSEDEERFLASETDLILGTTSSTTTTTASSAAGGGRIRGRARAITTVSAEEESDGTEGGSVARASASTRAKATTAKEPGRAKKGTKAVGVTGGKAGTKASSTAGGRRKVNGVAAAAELESGGGGLVQTLRKSYSLSDLSEPDTQRTQDEVDEIVNRPQRVLRSKSSRSSSGSRQMEMYFPEVEIAAAPYHATAAPPYNYIRSSDDISSGYSSAEPGLSRTASMSNTARPRLKSKTREDDEEYSADVFYDEQDQHMLYGRGGPQNDRFFPQQRATIYELHPGGSSSLPAITQAGHTVEHGAPPIYSSSNTQPSGVPAEMNDKYKLFLAWMEEQQRRENGVDSESSKQTLSSQEVATEDKAQQEVVEVVDQSAKDDEIASVKQEKLNNGYEIREEIVANVEPLPAGDDDFQDTISISSNENDEFLEVEAAEPIAEALEQDYSATDTVTTIKTETPTDEIEKNNSVPEETPEVVAKTEGTENEPNLECDVAAQLQTALTAEVQQAAVEIPAVVEEKEPNPTISVEETTLDMISQPEETSNLLAAASSNSNLTSSSSSLAISEGSTGSVINLAAEGSGPSVPPKKHPSFGKQRKAPPVPPPPEMIVVREKPSKPSTVTTTTTAPTVAVQAASKAEKTKVTAKPTATPVARSASSAAGSGPEKSKPKKFMSSLTGMFKGHGEQSATTPAQQSAATAGHPKETEI
uniref:Receptor expression-enhancing protein n=1 Tax=Anopheles melas TaxID=34690 RepID=A0A182TFP4_9DIPT